MPVECAVASLLLALPPLGFVIAHWGLLLSSKRLLAKFPALWTIKGKSISEVLPPHPRTKLQAFELGWHAFHYKSLMSKGYSSALLEERAVVLQEAAEAINYSEKTLTEKQLLEAKILIAQIDRKKSVVDRVVGFFTCVNILWCVVIIGLLVTIGPAIGWVLSVVPIIPCMTTAWNTVIWPCLLWLHTYGIINVCAYLCAFAFSAQGCRYGRQLEAGQMISLLGALAFIPCSAYTLGLLASHGCELDTRTWTLTCILFSMQALALVPLAIHHNSRLIGFCAVASLYGALGFCAGAFGGGFFIGFGSLKSVLFSWFASIVLVVSFVAMRLADVEPQLVFPFSTGALVLGNVMFFLALMTLSSSFGWDMEVPYWVWNGIMLVALVLAIAVGSTFAIPAMSNIGVTFLVLWVMQKELELDWGGAMSMVLFLNFVCLGFIAHYLHMHPQYIANMFDPSGLYLPKGRSEELSRQYGERLKDKDPDSVSQGEDTDMDPESLEGDDM